MSLRIHGGSCQCRMCHDAASRPDINKCDHEIESIGSDTVDVEPVSKWCPKCGLLLPVAAAKAEREERG